MEGGGVRGVRGVRKERGSEGGEGRARDYELELATLHGCSTANSSWTGVSEAIRAAVNSRMFGYLSARASSTLALNTCTSENPH